MSTNNTEYIKELYKVVNSKSILAINKNNELVRIYCPFRAVAKKHFNMIRKGDTVLVEKISTNLNLEDVYIIKSKAYLLKDFLIVG